MTFIKKYIIFKYFLSDSLIVDEIGTLDEAYLKSITEDVLNNPDLSKKKKVYYVMDAMYENGFFSIYERLDNKYLYMLFDGILERQRVRTYKAQWYHDKRQELKKKNLFKKKKDWIPIPPKHEWNPEEKKIQEEMKKLKENPEEVLQESAIKNAVVHRSITLDYLEQILVVALASNPMDPRLIELGLKILDRKTKDGYSDNLSLSSEELALLSSSLNSEEI